VTVEIVEVIDRSSQGVTRPFICRADNGQIYFVKGSGSGRRSQVCEWVAGNLGRNLGIHVAPFEIVQVPEELLENSEGTELSELGVGPAFGSCKQTVMELTFAGIKEVPPQTRNDLLLFDWWIHNEDRKLTEKGGNPNLFWEPGAERLVVIDHNQAFDLDFSAENFIKYHVFKDQVFALFSDWDLRNQYNRQFEDVPKHWDSICAEIPEEWKFVDPEMTVLANIDLDSMRELLERYKNDEFWSY
jgi:hypothetical protein